MQLVTGVLRHWRRTPRAEASAISTPVKAPAQPPASVAQIATPEKVSAFATPIMHKASATGPPMRNGRRPHRSDPAPAISEAAPQATEVIAMRLATSGRLVVRSRAMSIRNGARVVPLQDAANMPRQASASSAQGIGGRAIEAAVVRWWMLHAILPHTRQREQAAQCFRDVSVEGPDLTARRRRKSGIGLC